MYLQHNKLTDIHKIARDIYQQILYLSYSYPLPSLHVLVSLSFFRSRHRCRQCSHQGVSRDPRAARRQVKAPFIITQTKAGTGNLGNRDRRQVGWPVSSNRNRSKMGRVRYRQTDTRASGNLLWETSNKRKEMHTESVAFVAMLIPDEVQAWLIGNAEQVQLRGSVIQVRKRGEGGGLHMIILNWWWCVAYVTYIW